MKPASLLVPAAAAVLIGASLAFANAPKTATTSSVGSWRSLADEGGELEDAMYGLKNHLKKLSRALTPDTNAEALEHITEMQRIVIDAKGLVPSNLAEIPEAGRAKHQLAFRMEMLTLLTELIAIEVDVMEANYEGAMERLRGSLLEIRNRSHDKFQSEE
jgi:soluble cytochrome b562